MWQHQQLLLLPVPSQTVHVPSQTVHCLSFELLSKVRFEKNKELVPSQTAVHNHTMIMVVMICMLDNDVTEVR